jgi:hypothetical protein
MGMALGKSLGCPIERQTASLEQIHYARFPTEYLMKALLQLVRKQKLVNGCGTNTDQQSSFPFSFLPAACPDPSSKLLVTNRLYEETIVKNMNRQSPCSNQGVPKSSRCTKKQDTPAVPNRNLRNWTL